MIIGVDPHKLSATIEVVDSDGGLLGSGSGRNGCISAGLTVSFAVTDASAEDGGFACVPGSHKANFPSPFLDTPADR